MGFYLPPLTPTWPIAAFVLGTHGVVGQVVDVPVVLVPRLQECNNTVKTIITPCIEQHIYTTQENLTQPLVVMVETFRRFNRL